MHLSFKAENCMNPNGTCNLNVEERILKQAFCHLRACTCSRFFLPRGNKQIIAKRKKIMRTRVLKSPSKGQQEEFDACLVMLGH